MKLGDLVEVTWYDAWADSDESKPDDWRDTCLVRTVGIVVRHTEHAVSLAGEWFPEHPEKSYRNVTHIPLAMVKGRARKLA